jgi:hypothetical protein
MTVPEMEKRRRAPALMRIGWPVQTRIQKSTIGTYNLRGCFGFKRFPAAISIFLCAYDETLGYGAMANAENPVGKIVPLHGGEQLALVRAAAKELELRPRSVTAWDMPDFPPFSASLNDVFRRASVPSKRTAKVEQVYQSIEKLEPGTGSWIHITENKIGGYESFIQNSLVAELHRSRPRVSWRLIATYVGEDIWLGDAGILYILAGWDSKAKNWQWHCEWQCH